MTDTATTDTDPTATVTREQYTERIKALLPVLDEITNERGWCSERHRYFAAVMPEYRYERDSGCDRAGVNFEQVPEDTDYAARLATMRRRIMWYVKHETITVDMGDRVLAALGLEPVTNQQKPGERISVSLEMTLTLAPDEVEGRSAQQNNYSARAWAEDHLAEVIIAAMDSSTEPSRYIPGSAVKGYLGASRASNRVAIPESEVERPSYH